MMRRLSHQLLLWFIMIALVPFAIVAYLAYAGAERSLRAEVTNGLFAIARRQVDAIGAVVRAHERRSSVAGAGVARGRSGVCCLR